MTASAIVFLVLFWGFVVGLNAWCFWRIFRSKKRPDAGAK